MDILNEIKIDVVTFYLSKKSNIEKSLYFFMYEVNISNRSDKTIQLINRHWNISDANENVQIGSFVKSRKWIIKRRLNFRSSTIRVQCSEFINFVVPYLCSLGSVFHKTGTVGKSSDSAFV